MNVVDEDIATVYTVEEFRALVEGVSGQGEHEGTGLTSDKGWAHPCREEPIGSFPDPDTLYTEDSSIQIHDLDDIPEWATHIAWYNK